MPGQKGGLLDKIKAFFIRKKKIKLKKKEQEQKELEQILKNISEKVEAPSIVVNVGYAVDRVNLKNAVLTTPKKSVHVSFKTDDLKKDDNSKRIDDLLEHTKEAEVKEITVQEIAYETIDTMDNNELHRLREKLLSQSNVLPKQAIDEGMASSLDVDNNAKKDITSNTNNSVKSEKTETVELQVKPINEKKQELDKSNIKENIDDTKIDKSSINGKKSLIEEKTDRVSVEKFTSTKEKQPDVIKPLKDKANTQQLKKSEIKEKTQQSVKNTVTVNRNTINHINFVFDSRFKKKDITSFRFKNKKLSQKKKEQEISLILIRMIDRNLAELSYFKEELDYLTDKNKSAKTKEEIFEIEQRFLILKERLEKVYNDFLIYRNKNIIQDVGELSYNEELVDLITKYKLDIKDNGNIEQILRSIENDYKSSLNIIESIVCLEESKEILGDEIYKNKEDIRVRDEELSATDEVLDKINLMKEELDKNISSNKETINSIMEKIRSISPEERVRYQFNIVNNLINSALSFTFARAMLNPRNGRLSNALGAVCMLNSIRAMGRIFRPREEVYFVASNDFENEIIEHLNDFSYINKTIDLSIEEIDKIKNEFDDKYLHLIDDIPEIRETYTKINDLQDQLKDIKVEMKHQENRLEHSRELNNQIVKRIENN